MRCRCAVFASESFANLLQMLRWHKPIPLVLVLGIAAGRIIGRARLLPSRKLICRLRGNFARPSTHPFHPCYSVSIRGSKNINQRGRNPANRNRPLTRRRSQHCDKSYHREGAAPAKPQTDLSAQRELRPALNKPVPSVLFRVHPWFKNPKLVLGVATPIRSTEHRTPITEHRKPKTKIPPKKLSHHSCGDFNVPRPAALVSTSSRKLYSGSSTRVRDCTPFTRNSPCDSPSVLAPSCA
ncbi:MAG: hypothetical protein RLZZ232_139 [Planctomycetota bacterium]